MLTAPHSITSLHCITNGTVLTDIYVDTCSCVFSIMIANVKLCKYLYVFDIKLPTVRFYEFM